MEDSNSKEKIKLAIGIPTPQFLDPDFAIGNLQEIIQYTALNVTTNISVKYQTGVRTDSNRNVMLQEFLEEGFDYLLWLDSDMIYPPNIIEEYLKAPKITKKPIDVIGCLYFKRQEPYSPIAYTLSNDKERPYTEIPHLSVRKDSFYDVDGLGFGGLMVSRHTYDRLKSKKWHKYGSNFHLPFAAKDKLSHDLEFCKNVKNKGMNILMHGGIRPKHIGKLWVDGSMCEQKIDINKWPETLVIMPTTDKSKAKEASELMKTRAGMPCDIEIVEDKKRKGFVKVINDTFHKNQNYINFVYTAQDAYVGQEWLKEATVSMARKNAGLVSFNDGIWNGRLAQFGLVNREWALENFNNIFPDCYKANYCDTEITQVAKQQDRYMWSEKAIMIEVDYQKHIEIRQPNEEDKMTFNQRKKSGFDGKVTNDILLKEFS